MPETSASSGSDIVLSICIPTRQRRRYLESLLGSLAALDLPFASEIVVSDNASTDGTEALCRAQPPQLRLRYVRQASELSAFANLYAALGCARGRYAVYVGDDDRLFRDALVEAVAWLQANPGVSAFYAPLQESDRVDGAPGPTSRHAETVVDFHPNQGLELATFLLDGGIVPECGIYRTDCFLTLQENPALFFAHHVIERAIARGAIRFSPTPFYNSIREHFPGDTRPTVGHALIGDVQSWDKHRRGLEVLIYGGLLGVPLPIRSALLARFAPKLDAFVNRHLAESFQLLWHDGRFAETVALAKLMMGRGANLPVERDVVPQISLAATIGALSRHATTRGAAGIVLYGFPGAHSIAAIWSAQQPALPVDKHAASTAPDRRLLVAWDDALAAQARAAGWPPDHVVSFAAAYAPFDLAPWLSAFAPER